MSSKSETVKSKREIEAENLHNYTVERFQELLGKNWPLGDIVSLINAEVDYYDLQNLLERGCPKETAIRILL